MLCERPKFFVCSHRCRSHSFVLQDETRESLAFVHISLLAFFLIFVFECSSNPSVKVPFDFNLNLFFLPERRPFVNAIPARIWIMWNNLEEIDCMVSVLYSG